MKMADHYLLGWILASVLGLFAFYYMVYLVVRREEENNRRAFSEQRSDSVKTIPATNGERRSDDDCHVDVIIVGAGVAGSALAHTLGKVILFFPVSAFFFTLHFLGSRGEVFSYFCFLLEI